MKIEVRYFSRNGNTKKLAEAIASAVKTAARSTDEPVEERVDVMFLGSSVYAGRPDAQVTGFIRGNAQKIGRLVVFSTSASGKSTHASISAVAEDCGVPVSEAWFHCPGAFLFLHRNRPNAEDCEKAAAFARAQLE